MAELDRRQENDWLRVLAQAVWEQPQTAMGLAMLVFGRALGLVERIERRDGRALIRTRGGAVSLGHFVFYNERENRWFYEGSGVLEHEYGHSFQSRWLGPLYLPLVGIPSVARVLYAVAYREITGRRWRGYFEGWPERQADRLGGVQRLAIKARWPSK
jgi:hypothetical protein